VTYDDRTGTWLLRTSRSAYGLGVARDGSSIRHLHWGPPIDHADLNVLAERAADPSIERMAWAREEPAEYIPWGGLRYDEPTLKADFPDGTRSIVCGYDSHRITEGQGLTTLVIDLRDRSYPLAVELGYRLFDSTDVIERWARIRHVEPGGQPIVLRQAHSANWCLPPGDRWRLRYLQGGHVGETQLTQTVLTPGKFTLESRRGVTSHQANPWFALDHSGLADETHGEVWSGALAWSGSWKLVFETTQGGRLHISGGYNEFDAPLTLAPGSDLVLPVFAGVYGNEGVGGISRAWHAYQLGHVLARRSREGGSPSFPAASPGAGTESPDPPALRPVLYNSWEATTFSVDEAGQGELAEMAADMGAELFVVDDGWFAGRTHDAAGLGDWTVDPAKFPNGLDPLIKRVHSLGMRFGLWVEPEMVNPESKLYRAHPDWVLHFPSRDRSEWRHQLVLNLARPDVAEWVHSTIDRLLTEHEISFLKWDMNRHFSEPGWPGQLGRNPERVWIDHTRYLYEILDRLRADHPGLEIESCSGGGGRADLGILSRTEQVWTSDNTDASDRILIQDGFTHAYAPAAMMCWVTDSPNPFTGRTLPLSFRFHVAMAGSLGIGGDIRRWSAEERKEAKRLVAAYKAIRPLVQRGRLYRLVSPRDSSFAASEYLAEDRSELAVLAWWQPRPFNAYSAQLRLAGLDPSDRYQDMATGEEHRAGVLMHAGLSLPPRVDYSSQLVHLRRIGGDRLTVNTDIG
jgi:alpha-galactosidase